VATTKNTTTEGLALHPATFCWGGLQLIPTKDIVVGAFYHIGSKQSNKEANTNSTNKKQCGCHGHSSSLRQQGPQ